MIEEVNKLVDEMKKSLPGCLGVGVFSLKEGLIISADMSISGYDPEYAAAAHASNWNTIKHFLNMLPDGMTGRVENILLELRDGYFQLEVLGDEEFLLMAGIENRNNIGVLRTVMKKFKPKFERALEIGG